MNDSGHPVVPPTPTDAERLLLAGNLEAAAAIVAGVAAATADEPQWARLRAALAILAEERAPPGYDLRSDMRVIEPRAGSPPPDLPSLASGLPGDQVWRNAVDAERRLALTAAGRAESLLKEGKAQEARDLLEQALASLAPTSAMFRLFGRVNAQLNRPSDAVFGFGRAVDLAPGDRNAAVELALSYLSVCQSEDAAAMLAAAKVDPVVEAAAYSGQLQAMEDSSGDLEALRTAHRAYRAAAAARMEPAADRPPRSAIPVIGFLWHQEAQAAEYLMTDILRHRDRGRWAARLYGRGLTRRYTHSELASLVDETVILGSEPGAAIAGRIRSDGVDLLVNLAGHARPGMLRALDHHPARVHVEWLEFGWPSGHPAVSHIIADPGHCLPETGRQLETRVIRLPATAISGGVPLALADRLGRDVAEGRPFTFGWCGPAARVTGRTMDAWARILDEAEGTVLRLLHDDWRVGYTRERLLNRFTAHGIDGKRLEVDSPGGPEDRVGQWRTIDLALDSFPAGDIATTLNALAMGVPIVTIEGANPAGRHAAAALGLIGQRQLVAADVDDYVTKAVQLAASRAGLQPLRESIPEAMRASPLGGGPALTRAFEKAIDLLLGIQRGA